MGEVNKVMKAHNVNIRRGEKALHRSQAIVEIFYRIAEKLFGHQYAQDSSSVASSGSTGGSNARSREGVAGLPRVITALNKEPTRLIGNKTPLEAIKLPEVSSFKSTEVETKAENLLPPGIKFVICINLVN